jgi:hypothetical protein
VAELTNRRGQAWGIAAEPTDRSAVPQFVRSGSALTGVRLLIKMLADDAAGAPRAALRWLARWSPAHPDALRPAPWLRRSDHAAAGAPPRRATQQPRPRRRRESRRDGLLVVPTLALVVPRLTELRRLFIA